MARIRTIKPEFWDDEKLADLPYGCRLLFIGIWNFADDAGVIRANEKFIKSKIFPYDENLRNSEVKKWVDCLVESHMLIPVSHNGESYLIVRTFLDHQRIDARYKKHVIPESLVTQSIAKHSVTTPKPQRDHSVTTPQECNVSVSGNVSGGGEEAPPPKIDIPVSGEPTPPLKKPPPIPPTPPIGEIEISQCVDWYKSQAYEGTRQTVCMAKYIDMETLLDWVDAFGLKLTGEGEVRKSVGDFASHFFRWMKFQKTDVNPKTLIHEQKESNGQATNNNRKGGNTGGNTGEGLNAAYKRELADRMANRTGKG